ncbi:MAG: PAS domain S-box protein, partial [Solirubrobacterales bacterium]
GARPPGNRSNRSKQPPPDAPGEAHDRRVAGAERARSPGDELLEHGDGLVELDQDWVIVRVNAAQERTTGKSRSETLGHVFWEVWPEVADPQGEQWREYHRCMRERVPVQLVSYYRPFDTWFAITAYPTSPGGIAVFFRDVTVQKRAELALRAEHAFTSAVLDTVANVVVVLDRNGTIVRVNHACERATGYTASELIGRAVFDVFIRDDELPEVRETFRQLRAGHFPNQHENRWRMKDGAERTIAWNNTAILDDDGEVRFIIATGLDVTDRRRDEERLRASEAALDAFFAHSPGILNLVDDELRVVACDSTTPTYFGLTRDSIIGRSLKDIAPEMIARYGPMMRRVLDTGEPQLNVEVHGPVSGRPGELTHWRASYFPLPLPGGRRGIGVMGVEITDLKRVESALLEAERQYRSLAENAPEVIARFDQQLRHTYLNEYGAKVYGVRARDVLGRTNAELGMPADKVAFWMRNFEEVLATGEQRTVEFEFDGATFGRQSFSSLFVPERDGSGQVVSILAITRDVTEARRADERMREAEAALRAREEEARTQAAQLEAVLDAVADGLVVYDRAGRTILSTRAADELLRIPASERSAPVRERVGRQYEIHDESGRVMERDELIAYRAAVKGETVRGQVLSVRPLGGTQRWLRMNAVPFFRDGRHMGAVLSMTDITERKRAEDALRASEAKFRSVFEQAAVGMGRVRFSDARWIDVNDAFCRMLGRSREEMLRTPWPEITHPDDVVLDLASFRRMAAGDLDSYTVEKRFVHADGRHVWAKLTLSLVRGDHGRPDYEIAIIEDIGDRKRAEGALREANARLLEADRRKDEFLGMLSHELRNPLAPIRNSLYILDRSDPVGPQARRAREVARRQVGHMTRLVDDLLDVTRIARGKIELRRADLDLAALARRTAEDYRALMSERGLTLAVDAPDDHAVVNGDETR